MKQAFVFPLATELETVEVATRLAKVIGNDGISLFLSGNLGAGKTCFARGFLQALGHVGRVKSPTYTLVETYHLKQIVHHFDLYRLEKPEELLQIGIEEYFEANTICIVEWPEKAIGFLPAPDISCFIECREMDRILTMTGLTSKGELYLTKL